MSGLLHLSKKSFIITLTLILLVALFFLVIGFRILSIKNPKPSTLTNKQIESYNQTIADNYKETVLNKVDYNLPSINLNLSAESAIIIDASNGCIMYERKADMANPPASLTKLVTIYLALQAVENGEVSLSDIVPIRKEAYAKNAPPSSSLMFLDEGQIVTLNELLLGMAVVSGNDAAIAVAQYIGGSIENFVNLMNKTVKSMGLKYTKFVDPSGYSEKNTTTARDFAVFCRIYLTQFPWTTEKYHSIKELSYPLKHNLPLTSTQNESYTIHQKATNKVLSFNTFVDGLKTGFIYESGFNMAITAQKEDTRLIAIIMRGQGRTSYEGSQNRVRDCQIITDWFFTNFKTVDIQPLNDIPIPVVRGTENALYVKEIIPTRHTITVPITHKDKTVNIVRNIVIPYLVEGPIDEGTCIGKIEYKLDDTVLEKTYLVTDRKITQANKLKLCIDKITRKFLKK